MPKQPRRGNTLLLGGALVGAALAASGLLQPGAPALPADAMARVNEQLISQQSFESQLALIAENQRKPPTVDDRKRLLQRLIDEKLLVESGLKLDLAHSDPAVRRAIAGAMIDTLVAEAYAEPVDEAALRAFYDDNLAFFTPPGRLHLRQLSFRGADAAERAHRAANALLAGAAFAQVKAELADADITPLPDTPLPLSQLRRYLGPALSATAEALPLGTTSSPQLHGDSYQILWKVAEPAGSTPDYSELRDTVRSEFLRRRADAKLTAYLEQLRRQHQVQINQPLLAAQAHAGER